MLVEALREVELHVASDVGPTRDNNEDYCASSTFEGENGARTHLLVVADGLGGHKAGEVASRLAVECLLREAEKEGSPFGDRFLGRALQQANLAVLNHGHDTPECFNMQTTITALALQFDRLLLAHVGDCRAFRVRNGEIQQITTDHTRVNEMLRMRLITPEQALKHPARNMLTRSLGAELIVQVDTLRERAEPGDIYVACSDGLWSEVTSEEIRTAVTALPPAEACRELLATGTRREATDNMTVGVVRVQRVDKAPPSAPRWKSWLGRGG